jgi:putative Mn2+ efflux pump MntP
MDLLTSILIGIGLSMDCFAVALAIGTSERLPLAKTALVIAASFGIFQAGMTIAGWIAGASLLTEISSYGSWIAFLLLTGIGIKMIYDGLREEHEPTLSGLQAIPVILLSLATSIDAFAAGVSLGVLGSAVLVPALTIGLVCFVVSCAGVFCGMRLEKILGNRTEIFGGIILVLICIQILTDVLPL